jgi:hypothetical protein
MRRFKIGRLIALCAPILTGAALMTPLAPPAAAKTVKAGRPDVSTGAVGQVRGTSATLEGTVNPRTAATTYYFQYGPTVAYGSQTTLAGLPAGTVTIKVGQVATGLQQGYHYRLVATNSFGTTNGKDRVFGVKKNRLKFVIPKSNAREEKEEGEETQTVYGGTYVLSGTLSGTGGGLHQIALQASRYPYKEAFATIGAPIVTDAAGHFTFRVAHMTKNTQLRVMTLDPRPLYSRTITVQVAVRVTLKARSSTHKGLVRLYGTVTPAEAGAVLVLQVQESVRPQGKSRKTTKFKTQFTTTVKRGTKTISRFSTVVSVGKGGRYRAYVQLRKGALASGSSPTVTLKAPPGATKKKAKKKKG